MLMLDFDQSGYIRYKHIKCKFLLKAYFYHSIDKLLLDNVKYNMVVFCLLI